MILPRLSTNEQPSFIHHCTSQWHGLFREIFATFFKCLLHFRENSMHLSLHTLVKFRCHTDLSGSSASGWAFARSTEAGNQTPAFLNLLREIRALWDTGACIALNAESLPKLSGSPASLVHSSWIRLCNNRITCSIVSNGIKSLRKFSSVRATSHIGIINDGVFSASGPGD